MSESLAIEVRHTPPCPNHSSPPGKDHAHGHTFHKATSPPVSARPTLADVQAAVAHAHETEWSRVLSAVARAIGDLDLAEDSVEDAYVSALTKWVEDG
ncbi:MAG TPA: hypothetical protein PK691_04140, partial [Thermomicrobiales bacterium]|nr:hypothetical protein [Thermomicrobiales bacterium]